jgi:hypothetical protein
MKKRRNWVKNVLPEIKKLADNEATLIVEDEARLSLIPLVGRT